MNEQDRELQRRLRELLTVPERDRSDEQWDEIIELEIQLAPGNRIDGSNPMRPQGKNPGGGGGGAGGGSRQGRGGGGGGGRQNRSRGPGGGNPNGNQGSPAPQPQNVPSGAPAPQGEGRPAGANRNKRRKPANKAPKPPESAE